MYGRGGQAFRCGAAVDRTGHAPLHMLYGRALEFVCLFFGGYFALDLIMSADGKGLGCIAMCMRDGAIHRHGADTPIIANDGFGRAYQSCIPVRTWCGGLEGGRRAGSPTPTFGVPG